MACQPVPAMAPAVPEVPQGVFILSHDTVIVPRACLGRTWPLPPHSGHQPLQPPPPDSSLGVLLSAQDLRAVPCCSQFCLGGPSPPGAPQPPTGSRNPTGSSASWSVCSPESVSLPSCRQSCLTGTKLMSLSAPILGRWCHLPASSKPGGHRQVTLTPHSPLSLHTHHQLQPRLLQKPLSPQSYHLLPKQPQVLACPSNSSWKSTSEPIAVLSKGPRVFTLLQDSLLF